MNNSNPLDRLVDDYRQIKVPDELCIAVPEREPTSIWHGFFSALGKPAFASLLLAALILAVWPFDDPQQAALAQRPPVPSLSTLASLPLSRPTVATPSFSELPTPVAPKTPKRSIL